VFVIAPRCVTDAASPAKRRAATICPSPWDPLGGALRQVNAAQRVAACCWAAKQGGTLPQAMNAPVQTGMY